MMMYTSAVLWCFTIIHSVGFTTAGGVRSIRKLKQEQSSHRIITADTKRVPVPVIFDTDYGPFIDDGMFPSTLPLLYRYIFGLSTPAISS